MSRVEQLEQDYSKAVERERFVWDAAFTDVCETVGPFQLVPMTLQHLVCLRLIKSPFVCGGLPTPEDANVFLWYLSEDYGKGRKARRRFDKECTFFLQPKEPWIHFPWLMRRYERMSLERFMAFADILGKILEFYSETLQDLPPSKSGNTESYFSDAAAICHAFGTAYGWTREMTMSCPLKILFQLHKLITAEKRVACKQMPIPFKPSDNVRAQLIEELNHN